MGAFISLTPNEYLTSMNVSFGLEVNGSIDNNLGAPISLLSDLRAMGGMMLVIGLYILMANFQKDLMKSAVFISAVFYTTFSVFKTLSIMLDGTPQFEILLAFLIELMMAFSGLLLIFLTKHRYETKGSAE
ncbi:DUF4345 domain-containing protein [Thiomicrorhabdus sp. 6S2-11]|uniref:DUF4345 domain-containing protein n=1 Tax=Thiomicrorhabdus marina TaxID=2818442 RepID=A0ABS3Q7Q1_9GAMM|nr:DUF4345 domain-containing protein [Thiomicrorhabdus marina]